MTEKKKFFKGKYRWIVFGLMALNIVAARLISPISPEIKLPAEAITAKPLFSLPNGLGDVYLTNTMMAMLLVDLIVIILAVVVHNATRNASDQAPKGIVNALEVIIKSGYDLTESNAGSKWAEVIFPYFFSISFVVLLANMMELIPGVDSIGFIVPVSEGGNAVQALGGNIMALVKGDTSASGGYTVVSFVRTLSTDLNFTLALALFSVIMTQVVGVRAKGLDYFSKFWNTKTIFTKPGMGLMDWVVGILETISEFSKIISFTFRLFGSMFAGSILLFLVGSLVPAVMQSAVLAFEFFMGAIQALVFGMLTMIFMSMAVSHEGSEN